MASTSKGATKAATPAPADEAERAGKPTYEIKPVDSLPEKAPNKRAMVYFDLLTTVMNDHPGQWVEIAQFQTDTGAGMVRSSLRKGDRNVPGELTEWSFEARKVDVEVDGENVRQSRLYAAYKLPADAEQESPDEDES